MQILDLLRYEGPATATTLAARLGVATGSTSWHLHKLAEHGFIEEIPDRGNRRERWWRSVFERVLVQYAEAMEAGPEQAQATTEFSIAGLSHDLARAIRFLRQDWDFEWRYSAILNRYGQLVLDPESLKQMRSELWDVLDRYQQNPSTAPNAQRVIFTMQGYPYRAEGQPEPPPDTTEAANDPESPAE
jgi:predicted ArsR family transcriptional regulator